jgi:hypothetical protein
MSPAALEMVPGFPKFTRYRRRDLFKFDGVFPRLLERALFAR